ncbi:MAG: methyltransferase domain-containing protein [Chloracidobacterium sp.]|nr:methyltransferase domain-containing protein [Chloracidobacterium sp.]
MQSEDYENLYRLEEDFWWFAGMREITATMFAPFLPPGDRVILDAGCGTGGNLEWLARYAGRGRVVGIDLISTAIEFCRKRNHKRLVQASATDLPFAGESFDLITSFDVLSHILGRGADERAAREMFRVLKPGGIAFVRGAAYEWMKSDHDRALGTERRYRLNELREKLNRAGFEILRETYANTLLFPLAAIRRLLLKPLGLAGKGSDVKPLPQNLQWVNRVMIKALLWEAKMLRDPNAKLPAGLSAICVARRPPVN